MFDALYLSPHFDDEVISCGAQIYDRATRGEQVAVLTICAAPPPAELSPFAAGLHERWRALGDFDRAAEDRQALAQVKARPIHWALPDCIYRRAQAGEWLYASEAAIFGKVSPQEAPLVTELAARFESLDLTPEAVAFIPRAIGNHVDHQLVRAAGEKWVGAHGRPVRYYADYPYAEAVSGGDAVPLSQAGRRQKIEALRAYRSQWPSFWPDEATMVTKVSQWAERTF